MRPRLPALLALLSAAALAACATSSPPADGPKAAAIPRPPVDLPAECHEGAAGLAGIELPRALRAPQPPAPRGGPSRGYACVEVTIDAEGHVRDPRLLASNNPAFASGFVRVLPTWRFAPATRDGQPVAISYRLTSFYERRPL